jgi:hypothetical protein
MPKLCPGQDTRFWRPEDIFEIPCGACGHSVEFFKDDVYRRCPSCGKRVENPKFNLGCAQWCEHAKDCLGYDPKETEIGGEGGETLVDTLIERLKGLLEGQPGRLSRSLRSMEFAREILREEKADPRVTLLAALLHDVGVAQAGAREAGEGAEEKPLARTLMEEAGVHWSTVDRVCRLVGCEHGSDGLATPEARVAWDADSLAGWFAPDGEASLDEVEGWIDRRLHTGAGKALARRELARRRAG